MKNKSITVLALAFCALCFMGSCNKENDNFDIDTTTALDNSVAEGAFQDLFAEVNNEAAANDLEGFSIPIASGAETEREASDCATVTLSAPVGTFPNTMTIDFGVGCVGYYGIERSGKIIATFTGKYKDEGTVITVTTDNYYVNGNKVEGTKTITNMGENAAGNIEFGIVVVDGKITLATGEEITWLSTRTNEWVHGAATLAIDDDEYSITGNASGTNRMSKPFTMTITSALLKEIGCRYIKQGVLEISPEGYETRIINYGDGDCDNEIQVTIGGYSTTIFLP